MAMRPARIEMTRDLVGEPRSRLRVKGRDRSGIDAHLQREVAAAQDRLLEQVLRRADPAALASLVGQIIRKPVILVAGDRRDELAVERVGAKGKPTIAPVDVGVVDGKASHLHQSLTDSPSRAETLPAGESALVDGPHLAIPVEARGARLGYLVVIGGLEVDGSVAGLILDYAARLIAQVWHQQRNSAAELAFARETLLQDLLAGTIVVDDDALSRAQVLGCDLAKPRCLLVVETDPVGAGSSGADVSSRLLKIVTEALADVPALVARWQQRVVALVPLSDPGATPPANADAALAHAHTIERAVGAAIAECATWIAIVPECPDILDLPRSYADAFELLRIARRVESRPRVFVVDDRELRASQIVVGRADAIQQREFVDAVLGALERYDRHRHPVLVPTLEAYLEHNGNLEATAAALHVHVSTLKYRLWKIGDLGGLTLSSSADRFHAQLALRLRRLLDGSSRPISGNVPDDFRRESR